MMIFTVKDAAKYDWPVTVTGNANDSKVREIIETDVREIIKTDVRYTICDVTKPVCILLLRVHFILKHILKVQKILPDGYHIHW